VLVGFNYRVSVQFGKNDVFTDIFSAITRTEIDADLAEVGASLDISLQQTAFSTGESMQLVFDVMADPAMSITAELFFQGARIGYQEAPLSSSKYLLKIILTPLFEVSRRVGRASFCETHHSAWG